ncbi:MAG: PfkB family carbohydrate kinase, partial [Spirochaetota bacterium]
MLRLEPASYGRLVQRLPGALNAGFAGAEANVAVAFARLGGEAAHVTVVPDNPVADALERELRGLGVDTRGLIRSDEGRLGTFYTERGANQRPSVVVYDRAGSSIALADAARYDWDAILAGADWLHVTGITPAISSQAADATRRAVAQAAE